MNSVNPIILISSLIIATLLIFSLIKKEKTEGLKRFLFWGMVIPAVFTTLYLTMATVAKNQASVTGGPVHWHADFEIFACGQKMDLVDPQGLANRIGTLLLHEHGDDRIHIEGTVSNWQDITLGKFFAVIGGGLTNDHLIIPTNKGPVTLANDYSCPDGKKGKLQIFVYQTKAQAISQKKLTDFPNYLPSPYATIPPGDCIIIEFDPLIKNKTDKICSFSQIGINKGEYQRGD